MPSTVPPNLAVPFKLADWWARALPPAEAVETADALLPPDHWTHEVLRSGEGVTVDGVLRIPSASIPWPAVVLTVKRQAAPGVRERQCRVALWRDRDGRIHARAGRLDQSSSSSSSTAAGPSTDVSTSSAS